MDNVTIRLEALRPKADQKSQNIEDVDGIQHMMGSQVERTTAVVKAYLCGSPQLEEGMEEALGGCAIEA